MGGSEMKAPRMVLPFLTLAAIALAQPAPSQTQPKFRALAFYTEKTEGDHVDFAHDALRFYAGVAARDGWSWTATTNWDDLNDRNVEQYQLVVWLDDEPHTPAQKQAFQRYMEQGGGWIGFHASAYNDASSGWPWFVSFLGGAVFYGNNWPPLPARLTIESTTSTVTQGFGESYQAPANEWYSWLPNPRDNPKVKVLASLSQENYPLGLKDVLTQGDVPVVWTNTQYRMLYINMGHGARIFDSAVQNRLLQQAVEAVGEKKPLR